MARVWAIGLAAVFLVMVMVGSSLAVITAGVGSSSAAPAASFSVSTSTGSGGVSLSPAASGSPAAGASVATPAPLSVDQARANLVANARQAFINNGVSLSDFLPPNLNAAPGPTSTTGDHIVPLYDYAAAPIGISTFGLKNTSGVTTPYILNTTSLLGTFSTGDPEGLQVLSPYYGTLQAYGDQLNTVLNNTTILGNPGYDFWLQNVITYTTSSNTLSFELNIWNFSSPSGIFPSNSILHGQGRVESEEVYETSGPRITIAYPYTLDLYLNTTVGSYDGSPMVNEAYFNYTVLNGAGKVVCPATEPTGDVCGEYDNVYFNSGKNIAPGSAEMSANGYQYTPLGLPSDMEMDVGIGQSDGANANVVYSNATVGIYTLNATTHTYQAPPSTYDFGSETGETGAGASVSWNTVNGQPVAYERTGPSLLTGLWNVTGGTDGAPTIGAGSQGAFALNYAGVSPGNAFIAIAQGTGVTNQSFFQVAPTFGWYTGKGLLGPNLWLPTGSYTVEVLLSGYNVATQDVTLTSNQALSVTLTKSATPTVYTPLWAYSNSDLANLSVSGAGTLASPYVLVSAQPGSLAPVFGILNDYLFIVYSGVWINSTTAYFEFNPAPSLEITEPAWWYFQTNGLAAAYGATLEYNQLPWYFYHASNFVVENGADIGLWSSDIEVGHDYAVYCNVCSDSLFAGNHFNVSSEGIDLLGSGANQNNYVWGNTFTAFSDPALGGMSAPSTGLVIAEGGDHVYNNAFYTNRTLTSTSTTLGNFYNATGGYQPASNSITVNGVALTGSIVGGTVQGGNYYRDYGAYPNPYGVLPYVARASSPTGTVGIGKGGDYAPLATLPANGCAACRPNAGLYHVTFAESGLAAGKSWTIKVLDVPVFEPFFGTTYDTNPTNTSTTTSAGFWLPNGTYDFVASTTVASFGPTPANGVIVVNGASVTLPTIVFGYTYPVTFSESGLPYGLTWQVTVNGVSNSLTTNGFTDTLSFAVANGSSPYSIVTVLGWSQATLPSSGTVVVAGASVAEPTVVYTQGTYSVTFSESGLPAGLTWGVTFNGDSLSLTTAAGVNTLTFPSEPAGVYSYSIAGVSGWQQSSLPYHGQAAVNGAALTVSMTYSEVTYSVAFSESGLPSGLTWQVALNGATKSLRTDGGTDSLTFTGIANGSYAYTVTANAGWLQTTLPYSGSVGVSGAAVNEPTLQYEVMMYPVTFSESGLPSGLTWQVTVNGIAKSLTTDGGTDSLIFLEANGSYSYSIADISGWHQTTLSYAGSVPVEGAAVAEPTLAYTEVTYSVTFSESGLPSGLTWTVTVNGVAEWLITDGGTDTLVFAEANGTYSYTIADNSGWHQTTLPYSGSVAVGGASVSESTVVYSLVTYSVTFSESNLPSGLTWQVTVNGVTESLTTDGATDSLTFTGLANGTYDYSVADNAGWHQTTLSYSGSVAVSGTSASEPTLVYSLVTYTVTFSESGLPSGLTWTVTVNGVAEWLTTDGATDSLTFTGLANGTYAYAITDVSGWHQATLPYDGSVAVNGAAVTESTLVFTQVTYAVTFTESGLPSGTEWSVTIGGQTVTSETRTIVFDLGNGTFAYHLGVVPGFKTTANGSVTVDALGVKVAVRFSVTKYTITLSESGLPSGTEWCVALTPGASACSTTKTVHFSEPNGTYSYTISPIAGYHITTGSYTGSVTVNGANPAKVSDRWSEVKYAVTFTATGLPHGTSWQVTINGAAKSTSGTSITFSLPNGTYAFTVSAVGYTETSNPTSPLVVNGATLKVKVTFS